MAREEAEQAAKERREMRREVERMREAWSGLEAEANRVSAPCRMGRVQVLSLPLSLHLLPLRDRPPEAVLVPMSCSSTVAGCLCVATVVSPTPV